MELWLRAGELGCACAYYNVADTYFKGEGVERDMKKAKYYDELASIGGDANSRHNLGFEEMKAGNLGRAMKHWMIGARAGHDSSLEKIQECFMNGYATKNDFESALRAHKESKDVMKSKQREEAAAFLQSRGAGHPFIG